jgi:hypothetical protein
MKYTRLLFLVLAFFACKNKTEQSPSASQQVSFRDSSMINKKASNPYVPVDVSPMDMLYFPADYPIKKMTGGIKELPVMRVIYSRPHRAGRTLFGNLVQWGQPWRLGANEATEIEFFQPVTIQKKRIERGRYILYTIPFEKQWTLVLNSNLFSWGLKLNPQADVARFEVPSSPAPQLIEYFTMTFEKTATGANLLMAWENTEVRLPVQF